MALSNVQIDTDVRNAINSFIKEEFSGIKFSWSLVPYKSRAEGGLGVTLWTGWMALLDRFASNHLKRRSEYDNFRVGPGLVDATLYKNLTSLRLQLKKRLNMCATNCDNS